MRRQVLFAVGVVFSLFLLLGGVKYWQISSAIAQREAMGMPAEAVTTTKVGFLEWKAHLTAVGSVAPVQGVTLAAEEPGKVVNIAFESGAFVQQGTPLIEIDTSVEQANLRGVEAVIDRARRTLNRAESLRSKNAMSLDSYETAQEELRKAIADADSIRAVIARKKIVAPFAGQTGIRAVNIGQYVAAGAPLVPIQSLDPLYVNFSLPESQSSKLANGLPVALKTEVFPDVVFVGTVTAFNPQIEVQSRQIQVQATVQSQGGKLKPGMYVNVEIELPQVDKFLTVPASSVRYAPYGDTIYLVSEMKDEKGKAYTGVSEKIVRLGEKRGDQIAVLSGLEEGQEIVTSGVFKLRPNAAISVAQSPQPSMNANPTPADT